jgi:8-oxo-dGTP diphosphatase
MNPAPRLRIGAVIKNEDKFLLVEERIKSRNNDLYWLFPGGGVEYMEKLEDAVIRESKEETGLDVKPIGTFAISQKADPKENYHAVNLLFLASVVGGEIKSEQNANNLKWFTLEEALKLNLTPLTRETFTNYLNNTNLENMLTPIFENILKI